VVGAARGTVRCEETGNNNGTKFQANVQTGGEIAEAPLSPEKDEMKLIFW